MSGTKHGRLPWQTEPYVDHRTAQEQAIAAAQPRRRDPKDPAVQDWARAAFDNEIGLLQRAVEGECNSQLFKSGVALYEIVAAGALDEHEVTDALRDACRLNGYEQRDGEGDVLRSIRSARNRGLDNPRDLSHVGLSRNGSGVEREKPKIKLDSVFDLEHGFWTKRESLQTIYLGALSRMCSPWAVLGHCAARALYFVPPNQELSPLIGIGSLNWFCAVTGLSGGHKSAAGEVARQLINEDVFVRNLGSGEGLVEAYKCSDEEYPGGTRPSVMFIADEVDSLKALGDRNGSTLNSTLRSAFSGGTLGFSYRSNKLHLEARTYRLTLVVNVQPAKAGALLDDPHGGMLQRFMWFPATDPRITAEVPMEQAPLKLPFSEFRYACERKPAYEAIELIRDEAVRRNRGETNTLDGHALFVREKFAYALAVLDGRAEMNEEDWRLSGIASRLSDRTRDWVTQELQLAREQDAERKGADRGMERHAADTEYWSRENKRRTRCRGKVIEYLTTAGESGMTRDSVVNDRFHSRDRASAGAAFDQLVTEGKVVKLGSKEGYWVLAKFAGAGAA